MPILKSGKASLAIKLLNEIHYWKFIIKSVIVKRRLIIFQEVVPEVSNILMSSDIFN